MFLAAAQPIIDESHCRVGVVASRWRDLNLRPFRPDRLERDIVEGVWAGIGRRWRLRTALNKVADAIAGAAIRRSVANAFPVCSSPVGRKKLTAIIWYASG